MPRNKRPPPRLFGIPASAAPIVAVVRGLHFVSDAGRNELGEPDVGDVAPLVARLGLALTRAEQFAVERRRGLDRVARHPIPPFR